MGSSSIGTALPVIGDGQRGVHGGSARRRAPEESLLAKRSAHPAAALAAGHLSHG
jgi:hypothetical protein